MVWCCYWFLLLVLIPSKRGSQTFSSRWLFSCHGYPLSLFLPRRYILLLVVQFGLVWTKPDSSVLSSECCIWVLPAPLLWHFFYRLSMFSPCVPWCHFGTTLWFPLTVQNVDIKKGIQLNVCVYILLWIYVWINFQEDLLKIKM